MELDGVMDLSSAWHFEATQECGGTGTAVCLERESGDQDTLPRSDRGN